MDVLLRSYRAKLYPGADVRCWNLDHTVYPGIELNNLFVVYLRQRNIQRHLTQYTLTQMAIELNFELIDRYRFLTTPEEKREGFVLKRIEFQLHILQQEEQSKDKYHLN
jgi:hypothetical protein